MTVLAAFPALAADPFFTLTFESTAASSTNGGINGIKGLATYTFSETTVGQMTLSLKNLSGSPATKAYLVSSGFNEPTNKPAGSDVEIVSFLEPDSQWDVALSPANGGLSPFGSFDACASTDDGECDASGKSSLGLAIGSPSKDVAIFTLKSSNAQLTTATAYRDAFVKMFKAPTKSGGAGEFDGNYFMRFKGLEGTGKYDSDKIWATGVSTGGGGGQAPGDAVPGPLPVLGAAAAFGYSRKLRQRLKAAK
ncbi:hypothetical protein [Cyanobium gracile]|uniref:PEP-CTERM sorting domain-containing protein n=1 Tax=Cyanobium gracile UHCC 0281 TaxID=3110309 RepID=A0ABU5SZQ1_9CYAN|nr:hypothetical protein [Cyanobium gracile]MEA5443502.1 hypothetical protein [Cyanobium gracile UHCC 0281]